MRVVALLAVRNEELYLERCLDHLHSQGIEICLIDNGSTDRTIEIAKSFSTRGVFRIENIPFNGIYEWKSILTLKENLAMEIEADWFIHHDADEIREAPQPYKTLREGIEAADKQGYNAINFDEFVFIPVDTDGSFEGRDFVREMKQYYFFEPRPLQRINAWKKSREPVNLAGSGGHQASFKDRKIFPVNFFLRHYVFLSGAHATAKYSGRVYSREELAMGWHKARAAFEPALMTSPEKSSLKSLSKEGTWDRSDPLKSHLFLKKE